MLWLTRRLMLRAAGAAALAWLGGRALRRATAANARLLRPPGAGGEDDFLSRCIRCQQCVEVCPVDALHPAGAESGMALGTPCVVARSVPCNLCLGRERMECTAVCPTEALVPLADRRAVRMGLAVIDLARCWPFLGIVCKACWHACPFAREAITFDERGWPRVVEGACVGCGLCEHACPAEPAAIRVTPRAGAARGAS